MNSIVVVALWRIVALTIRRPFRETGPYGSTCGGRLALLVLMHRIVGPHRWPRGCAGRLWDMPNRLANVLTHFVVSRLLVLMNMTQLVAVALTKWPWALRKAVLRRRWAGVRFDVEGIVRVSVRLTYSPLLQAVYNILNAVATVNWGFCFIGVFVVRIWYASLLSAWLYVGRPS